MQQHEVDFNNELACIGLHDKYLAKAELQSLVERIYIHKWNVKRQSPYLYAGEKTPEYFNQRYFQTNNALKSDDSRDPDKRLILGIESSFDDSCAGIVAASGKTLANAKRCLNKQWDT